MDLPDDGGADVELRARIVGTEEVDAKKAFTAYIVRVLSFGEEWEVRAARPARAHRMLTRPQVARCYSEFAKLNEAMKRLEYDFVFPGKKLLGSRSEATVTARRIALGACVRSARPCAAIRSD